MHEGIPACLRCGSAALHLPGTQDAGLVGAGLELNEWACDDCGWRGIPVFFTDEKAREAFQATLTDADGT